MSFGVRLSLTGPNAPYSQAPRSQTHAHAPHCPIAHRPVSLSQHSMADVRRGYLPDKDSNWQPDLRHRQTLPQLSPPRSINEDLSTDPSRLVPAYLRPHGRASIITPRLPSNLDLYQDLRFAVSPRAERFVRKLGACQGSRIGSTLVRSTRNRGTRTPVGHDSTTMIQGWP